MASNSIHANYGSEQTPITSSFNVADNFHHRPADGRQYDGINNTSSYQRRERNELPQETAAPDPRYIWSILSELADIGRYIWRWCLKPVIIVSVICLIFYFGYTKVVCRHACFMPFVCTFCPSEGSTSVSLPPLHVLAQKSASLADALSSTDTSATLRFVQAKTALIDVRAQVEHSEIDPAVKSELLVQLHELQGLVHTGTDQLIVMLASFSGALDNLQIYTKFALRDLDKLKNAKIYSQSIAHINQGEPGTTQLDMLTVSFNTYVSSTNSQVDGVLEKAEIAHLTLELIIEKLTTVQNLNHKGKQISHNRLIQLQNGSFWSWLFDEGQMGIEKHRRNLQTLDGFIDFVKMASNSVGDAIVKLKSFKYDAEHLKETAASLEQIQRLSIDMQSEILEAALNRLSQSKDIFMGKISRADQSQSNPTSREIGMDDEL